MCIAKNQRKLSVAEQKNYAYSVEMKNLRFWLLAARPKTLTAAVVPILVGTALPVALGKPYSGWVAGLALLASLFIQIATNLINDVLDFKKGADTETRLGPQRVTQSAIFKPETVQKAAYLCFFIAILCGIPLVMKGGMPILIIGILSLIAGYAYTGGPFPLAYKGLGDVFVVLFFGLIAVGGIFYLHTGEWSDLAFFAGLQVGFLCAVLIAINNLRDVEGDSKVGKKTLPVRFGKAFAKFEIIALCLVPFLMGGYWWSQGHLLSAWLPLLTLPLALLIAKRIFETEPSPIYNQFLAMSGALHLFFGALLALGFCL